MDRCQKLNVIVNAESWVKVFYDLNISGFSVAIFQ